MALNSEQPRSFITLSDKFRFACRPGLKCFNSCCRNVNIFLTPDDVFRMKRRLNITSTEFLERYTLQFAVAKTGLPVVMLKMKDDPDKSCPFVTPEGCSIYSDRPWSCRLYPLSYNNDEDYYEIVADPSVCLGFSEAKECFLEDWLAEQGVLFQREIDRLFNEALARLEFPRDRITNPKITRIIHLAAYDLDAFRRFVFETRFLKIFDIPPALVERIKANDEELARLAFQWLRFGLADKNVLPLRDEIFNVPT